MFFRILLLALTLATGSAASAKPVEAPDQTVVDKNAAVPVFRFVNLTNGKSFYTHSLDEIAHMRKNPEIWMYKEIGFWVKPTR